MITSIDLFAGGGGTSCGIHSATGSSPFMVVDNEPLAIEMHKANHPNTIHVCDDVRNVAPFAPNGKLDLLVASPPCIEFSRAKGKAEVNNDIQSLAWEIDRWAQYAMPSVILIENVTELQHWGPLDKDHRPIRARRGETFSTFTRSIESRGYDMEWNELVAADYGAPTSRKRLIGIARCDGHPIRWPEATHGPGMANPYRTAAECIDWSIPSPSIFASPEEARAWGKEHKKGTPRRPLAENTMKRISAGIQQFVIDSKNPFIVKQEDGSLMAPTLIQTGYGERKGQAPRVLDLHSPLGTIMAGGGKHALVCAFLTKYYGQGVGQSLHEPLHTIRTKSMFRLVTVRVDGETYTISDVSLRMLSPRELARAQGFPEHYILTGNPSSQVARIGNSVPPPMAHALIRAQFHSNH